MAQAQPAQAVQTTDEQKQDAAPAYEQSVSYQKNRQMLLQHLSNLPAVEPYPGHSSPNVLNERYELLPSQELPQFTKQYAKAYAVKDLQNLDQKCIGYVTDHYQQYRHHALTSLQGVVHRHLIELLDAGVIYCKEWNSSRCLIVYRQPEGTTLQSLLEQGEYYKSTDALKQLIVPITAVLHKFNALDIGHGSIHPGNIFIQEDGTLVLGDCIAEPAGSQQPLIYEPLEHLLAMREARGESKLCADVYALAILVLDCCNLLGSKKQWSQEQLAHSIFNIGTYHSFVNEEIIPGHLVDFFRGVLHEIPQDRWNTEQLIQYAGGKRFNLIPASAPRDTKRSYEFEGLEHYTTRKLAHSYHQQWDNTLRSLKDKYLMKWIETIGYQQELKDRMVNISGMANNITGKGSRINNLIARAIIALDTNGPIRYQHLSIYPNHMPLLLCNIIEHGDTHNQVLFREILNLDLVSYWREVETRNYDMIPWNPQIINAIMRYKTAGFGIERLMYELNPTMPCMSRDYAHYHAITAKDLLIALNHEAHNKAASAKLTDKHVISFLAARTGIRKEIKPQEYDAYPELKNNLEFQSIIILAYAQDKTKLKSLPGLTTWSAMRLIQMIESFHSKEVRDAFSNDLKKVLPYGKISYIVRILRNKDYIEQDRKGYARSCIVYERNHHKILKLKNKKVLRTRATRGGIKTAFIISLLILFVVCYYLLSKYTVY